MEKRDQVSQSAFSKSYSERRRKARTQGPIPASVRGVDSRGRTFNMDTMLDNISSGGLYLRVPAEVDERATLSVSFFLSASPGLKGSGTRWQAMGVIRRVEPQTDGTNGLGIEFTKYCQLWQNGDSPHDSSLLEGI